jgi:ribosomal 30S subunit maturation factor RimM
MVSKFIATLLLSTALMTSAAPAQTNTGSKESATTQTDEYSAYKLVDVDVYNQGDEKIGTVKDVLLVKSGGKADKIILSVGGFLGLGEHYVAVPY